MGRTRAGAYLGAAWIAVLAGAVGGWVAGVAGMLAIGLGDARPGDIVLQGAFGVPFGVGIAVVGGGAAAAVAAWIPRPALLRPAAGAAAAGILAALGTGLAVGSRLMAPVDSGRLPL